MSKLQVTDSSQGQSKDVDSLQANNNLGQPEIREQLSRINTVRSDDKQDE